MCSNRAPCSNSQRGPDVRYFIGPDGPPRLQGARRWRPRRRGRGVADEDDNTGPGGRWKGTTYTWQGKECKNLGCQWHITGTSKGMKAGEIYRIFKVTETIDGPERGSLTEDVLDIWAAERLLACQFLRPQRGQIGDMGER